MATIDEDISSQVDGVATAFTITGPKEDNTLRVWLDGIKQGRASDGGWFTETPTGFTVDDPPDVGSRLSVQYEDSSGDVVGFTSVHASGIPPTSL